MSIFRPLRLHCQQTYPNVLLSRLSPTYTRNSFIAFLKTLVHSPAESSPYLGIAFRYVHIPVAPSGIDQQPSASLIHLLFPSSDSLSTFTV